MKINKWIHLKNNGIILPIAHCPYCSLIVEQECKFCPECGKPMIYNDEDIEGTVEMKKPQYMIFVRTDGHYAERQGETCSYVRYDCKPFDTLEATQDKIKDICFKSSYKMSDFRIFEEFPIK